MYMYSCMIRMKIRRILHVIVLRYKSGIEFVSNYRIIEVN